MHNDEGVNAMKFRALYVNNNYKYDPNEFHGPTLPYLTLPPRGSAARATSMIHRGALFAPCRRLLARA